MRDDNLSWNLWSGEQLPLSGHEAAQPLWRRRGSRHVVLQPGRDLAAEFPRLEALVFDVTGLHVKPTDDVGAAFIEERVTGYRRTYALETLKDEPRLRAYRDFFWRGGVDPTKVRPAAEALLRRVIQGKPLPRINALVDAYNLGSAETRIALAAFDKTKLRGDLRMRRSRPAEAFLGIGMESPVTLTGVEVVCEDADRLVAIYPYRDADASKVTPATRDVRFLVCGVPGISHEALREAAAVAANTVMRFCGGATDGAGGGGGDEQSGPPGWLASPGGCRFAQIGGPLYGPPVGCRGG